jgi:hypothetical protein
LPIASCIGSGLMTYADKLNFCLRQQINPARVDQTHRRIPWRASKIRINGKKEYTVVLLGDFFHDIQQRSNAFRHFDYAAGLNSLFQKIVSERSQT